MTTKSDVRTGQRAGARTGRAGARNGNFGTRKSAVGAMVERARAWRTRRQDAGEAVSVRELAMFTGWTMGTCQGVWTALLAADAAGATQ